MRCGDGMRVRVNGVRVRISDCVSERCQTCTCGSH